MLFWQSVEEVEVHIREDTSSSSKWSSLGSVRIHTAGPAATTKLRKERQMLKNLVDDKIEQDCRRQTCLNPKRAELVIKVEGVQIGLTSTQ